MKLISFKHDDVSSYGLVEADTVFDIGAVLRKTHPTLHALLGDGGIRPLLARAQDAPQLQLAQVIFEPVIPNPARILCVGINYASHIAETGRPTPEKPVIFVRFPDSQVGHRQSMLKPRESNMFDYEGELAVIIGRRGRRVPHEQALSHVAGYACYNDGSIRDWQRHTSQFTPGKTFPGTGAFGPWLVTPDEIPDPSKLTLVTRLNGQEMQRAPISDLVFDVPALIAYCSVFTNLEPGDVIVTGTPGGVGAFREPPVWMKDSDTVEVEISGIGVLRNPVRAEP